MLKNATKEKKLFHVTLSQLASLVTTADVRQIWNSLRVG